MSKADQKDCFWGTGSMSKQPMLVAEFSGGFGTRLR